jgi:HAMP domain-containing protein
MTFRLTARRALEHEEQTALFAWAKVEARRDPRLELLHAIPNGMAASSIAEASRAKRTGMKAGVPDICLPVPAHGFHGLYIELKRTGGTPLDVKPEQSLWLERLNLQHYRAVVAYGWQDAMNYIQQYLETT